MMSHRHRVRRHSGKDLECASKQLAGAQYKCDARLKVVRGGLRLWLFARVLLRIFILSVLGCALGAGWAKAQRRDLDVTHFGVMIVGITF